MTTPILDCQDCGTVLRYLSPKETQLVALNPDNFVMYCAQCKRDRVREGEDT